MALPDRWAGCKTPAGIVKILLVNWQDRANPYAGGAEIHLFEIFGRLAARGHQIRLVCSGWEGATREASIDLISIRRVGGRHSFALLGRRAVQRAIAEDRPDILVEDINKLPLFLAVGTSLPFCAMVPHLFGETAFEEAPWPMAAAVWLAERPLPRAYRRAGFHAISESTRDDLIARGVPADRVRVIHPGVDSRRFTPGPQGYRSTAPSFLYVGRLKRYKGIGLALDALALARRQRPDLRMEIAGIGDYRVELERQVARLELHRAVTFHGFVSEERKIDLMRWAWANVFPSPKEGWGITVIEAAACGTPSLASESPGLRDSVRHGETGFLIPHGDVAGLAARMLELADSPVLVARLGERARRFAESLTWERTAAATERHLQDIIDGSAAG
ncbi:MAG TPA: glycosyltransferase family 4 protein [Gemmatimonadales bacterium]|nr:glycosyltransferase family 4 protein [Gemmatimonadales bacterium]